MTQLLHTGRFGTIEVEKSWVDGNLHICKLAKGGYVYASGLPVTSDGDLRKVIPAGPEREEALRWLENREAEPAEPQKHIVVLPDGSCQFSDGSPVEDVSDILKHIPPGPFQDAAYKWLQEKKAQEKKLQELAAKASGQAALAVRKGLEKKSSRSEPADAGREG